MASRIEKEPIFPVGFERALETFSSQSINKIMENKGDGKKRKMAEEANGAALQLSTNHLHSLLETLSKEQSISLPKKLKMFQARILLIGSCLCVDWLGRLLHRLYVIGSSYPTVAEEIKDVASKDPAHRKLFVRGLAWETSSQTLCDVNV